MKKNLTEIVFILDRSGSMAGLEDDTIGGFNAMIQGQKEKYGWEFLFLGANIDAAKEAARFGISADHAANYHADSEGTNVIYETVSEAITQVRCCAAPLSADWKQQVDEDYKKRGK